MTGIDGEENESLQQLRARKTQKLRRLLSEVPARNLLSSDQEDALADEYHCTVSAMVQVLLRALCAS